jgi:hypothetical protein
MVSSLHLGGSRPASKKSSITPSPRPAAIEPLNESENGKAINRELTFVDGDFDP